MFCKLPQEVNEIADEFESSPEKKPKLFDGIDDTKLRVHHQQASEPLTSYMSEPRDINALQNKLQGPPSVGLPVMVAECRVLVEEYFSKGIFEFTVQELKERYKMRFGYRLDEKAKGYEGIDEFLQHVMPGRGLRSMYKGTEKFITCDTKCLNQNFLKQHPGIITKEEVRAWLENLVWSGRASLGIDLSHIRRDFEIFSSKPLDYKSLHHRSLMKLLLEFEDLVRIERCGCRTIVFPQHGAKLMYKKPQVRVVNNTPTTQQEILIKPVGVNYIRPRKNVHLMKRIKPEVPPVPPGNFPVPYKLRVPVEDPICSTIARAIPRTSTLEELVQSVEVVANCRSLDSSSQVAAAHLKAREINGGETVALTSNLTDPIRSMAMPRSSILEELVKPMKIVPNCRISPDSSGAHLKTHGNCSESAALPRNLTDPIIPSMAMPSSLVEETMQPVEIVANYRSSDSSKVVANLKTHENCSGRSALPSNLSGGLSVTDCRANVEVMPFCIHEPQNPPFSPPMPNPLEVRAAASATDSLKVLREREEIKNTLQSISHVLTVLDKDRERIRRLNIATNTAIKK